MRTSLFLIACLALLSPVAAGAAPTPSERARHATTRALEAIERPAALGDSRLSLRPLPAGDFDFDEMARRALGQHWRSQIGRAHV